MYSSSKNHLIELATILAAHLGVKIWRIGHLAANRGAFFVNLDKGHTCQLDTCERVSSWFAHNWPDDLPWPDHIPNPKSRETIDDRTPRPKNESCT